MAKRKQTQPTAQQDHDADENTTSCPTPEEDKRTRWIIQETRTAMPDKMNMLLCLWTIIRLFYEYLDDKHYDDGYHDHVTWTTIILMSFEIPGHE